MSTPNCDNAAAASRAIKPASISIRACIIGLCQKHLRATMRRTDEASPLIRLMRKWNDPAALASDEVTTPIGSSRDSPIAGGIGAGQFYGGTLPGTAAG